MWRLEEELDRDAFYHRFCSNYTANTLHKEALEKIRDLKIGG
jgi:hypothetical protein